MTSNIPHNIRKAAVLIRSLDGETAASLLARLSAEEASALRAALRSLGPIDPSEQANVATELRQTKPRAVEPVADGVELMLSNEIVAESDSPQVEGSLSKRFVFFEKAPIDTLVLCLTREHAQAIAVVLSHLEPARAAAVLGALPDKLQADTVERLSTLGDTDPESVTVLERELAAWLARQPATRRSSPTSNAVIRGILAEADQATRCRILANLHANNERLAAQLTPHPANREEVTLASTIGKSHPTTENHDLPAANHRGTAAPPDGSTHPPSAMTLSSNRSIWQKETQRINGSCSGEAPRSRTRGVAREPFRFEDLNRLSTADLSLVLQEVEAHVMVLALAGASDELIERIAGQMPKSVAKAFHRQLWQLGPTRLSDVEAAQQVVANTANRRLRSHQPPQRIAV
jgi:flagellar motor switch protein FliG